MSDLVELESYLRKRIEELTVINSSRIMPGELDSIEYQQVRGRLMEDILTLSVVKDLKDGGYNLKET
jgi:hypothetical protein